MNSSEFLTELRAGRIRENTEYTVSGSVVFDTRDSGKHYDLKNAGLVILPDSCAAIRFGTSENVTLENARITTDADIAVLLDGKDNALVGCGIRTPNNGIIDRGNTGSLMERNRITAGKVGIASETADSVISRNTVDGGKCGIRAAFARSEISAAMYDGYNILVSENLVRGAELSLDFKNVSNGVVLLNSLENAAVCGCTNIYVAENRVSGVLKLQMNRYLLANANRTDSTVVNENSEINGDTVTDVRERSDVGVNEKLLPHINRELFVGMRRKTAIRTATGFVGMYDYITSCYAEGRIAVIPPGAYANGGMDFSETEGLTVYAYGVLDEINTRVCSVFAQRLKNFTLKGMFFANEVYPCSQGTVLEYTEDKTLTFRTDPGYRKDFTDGRFFGGTAPVFHYLAGEISPECEFRYSSKTYDAQTDVNTLRNISAWWKISPGDRVALRTDFSEGAMHFVACDGIYLEDVTVFCCSGFAISDTDCEVAPLLHRYAVVEGPAPVLTEDEPIPEGAKSLIWCDSYGRLRAAPPMFTTCDATHCTNARRGIHMVSCLLENMNDDGGNINAYYGLAHSYDPVTKTLTYTRCNDPHGYQLLPSTFRRGDSVMLYTMSGRLVADGFVTSDTVRISPDGVKPIDERYTVMLSEDIDLPEDEQVAVQNTSASGNGFLLDNVMIRNEGARGIRIKAVDGEIRNCTFDGISKGGIDCIPEFSLWPECGYVRNIRIVKNIFRNLSRTAKLCENDESEWCAPICIRYTLWDKGANATSDPAYCLHRDIEISDNTFTGRYSHYEITASAVRNLRIVNNRFEDVNSGAIPSEKQYPVMINGGNGIVFDGNSFPERMEKRIFYHYGKDTTDNVSGSDAL